MFLVQGWVRFAPEAMAKFREAGATMVAETNKEDGCLHYAFAEDLTDPGLVLISERWRDEAAIAAHGASAHMAAFLAAMGALGPQGSDIRLYSGEELKKLG